MSELDYTYAVARVRALETTLLSAADIDRLIACQNERQCLQFLAEKGGGKPVRNLVLSLHGKPKKPGKSSGSFRWIWAYLRSWIIPTGSTT